jgi:tRNA(fMet)-specific endonuclease VapC
VRYLVDSDWVADYLKGRPVAGQLLDALFPDGLVISIVTYAEVFEGIYFGRDPSHYEGVFQRFLRGVQVLGVNRRVVQRYARFSGELRSQGLLIPPADLFIAATALQHRLILVTRNRQHFERIPDLRLQ